MVPPPPQPKQWKFTPPHLPIAVRKIDYTRVVFRNICLVLKQLRGPYTYAGELLESPRRFIRTLKATVGPFAFISPFR